MFEVKRRAARKARNPRTGEKVFVPEKFVVTFKPGKEMEERVREMERRAAQQAGFDMSNGAPPSDTSRPANVPEVFRRKRFSDRVAAMQSRQHPTAESLRRRIAHFKAVSRQIPQRLLSARPIAKWLSSRRFSPLLIEHKSPGRPRTSQLAGTVPRRRKET